MREPYNATYCLFFLTCKIPPSYIPGIFLLSWMSPLQISLTLCLGSDMTVLSAAPLRCPFFKHIETVPFTKTLLHQHEEPVQCIPFSTSPFSILDIASSHPPSYSIMINEDLSINPSSVKTNLVKLTLFL